MAIIPLWFCNEILLSRYWKKICEPTETDLSFLDRPTNNVVGGDVDEEPSRKEVPTTLTIG